MVERTGTIPFTSYRPMASALPPAEPPTRGGTEDSRRCDAARDEQCVDAFRAGPGAVPFPDYLGALNATAGLVGGPTTHADVPARQTPRTPEPARRDQNLPRLGDVAPVVPDPATPHAINRDVIRHTLGTGRLIDVVI